MITHLRPAPLAPALSRAAVIGVSGRRPAVLLLAFLVLAPLLQGGEIRRTLRAGGDENYPPYEFLDETGQPAGFNIDVFRAVCAILDLEATIELGPWSRVREDLESGDIDLITGMYFSPDRDEEVDFSPPHIVVSQAIFVRDGSPVRSLEDLQGREVLVQDGDIMHDFLRGQERSVTIVPVADPEEALRRLAAGRHDCALVSKLQGLYLRSKLDLAGIRTVGPALQLRDYCFAVREGDRALLTQLNEGLALLRETGEYRRIYLKWFGVHEAERLRNETLRILAWVLGPIVLLVALVLAWNALLRRRVRVATADLRTELDHRRIAEHRADEAREQLQTMADSLTACIAIVDREERYVFANNIYERLLGRPPSELVGKRIEEVFGPEVTARIRPHLDQALAGERVSFDNVHPTADGSSVTFHVEYIPRRNAGGEPDGFYVLAVDITERKRLEERLRHAEKMDAIGQLAGGVAHDFNNQLAGIMGYADLLATRIRDPDQLRLLEGILATTQRAADLTGKLLAFARKGKFLVVRVDLHELVGEVASLLRHTIDRRIRIRQRLDADCPVVQGDPGQLQNAILNLGLNARDAMPEGGELIFATETIHLDEKSSEAAGLALASGDYVALSVTDNGSGMDAETRRRALEPFFTTKAQGKGVGMGLPSVFGAVQAHHGTLFIYSEPGRGATVRILLPVDTEAEAEANKAPDDRTPELAPARILLVDDEPAIRETGAALLQNLGHTVITAEDGQQAVDRFRADPGAFDLVILDMVMPHLGGREAYRALRAVDPGVKVLLASGYSLNGEAQGLLDEGVLGFLQKPYRQDTLRHAVRQALLPDGPGGTTPPPPGPFRSPSPSGRGPG
ncbi:MAG: transporter substrate-binding domain-containing protein [Planctomycetota bacterium]